jgi:hypothetical protein
VTVTVTVTGLADAASARVTEIGGTTVVQAEPAAVGLSIEPSTPLSLSPGQTATVKTTEHNAGPGDASGTTPAPDTAAYAQSAPVRRLDQAMSTWFSGQFRQLGDQAPWLRPTGQPVLDYCDTSGTAAAFSGPSSWSLSQDRASAQLD